MRVEQFRVFLGGLLFNEIKNWLVALHLDSGNHLDTLQYETGYYTNWFNLAPKRQRAFDWVYACWNRFGSVATARHHHVGNICVQSFSNRTRPKHFWETDNCGLVDLRTNTQTQRYAVELVLHVGPKKLFLPSVLFSSELLMSKCVCVCVPSITIWHSLHVINIHLHLRENQTGELASGGVLGISRWFGQKNNTPVNSHYALWLPPTWQILAWFMNEECLYKHILGWCNTNATQNITQNCCLLSSHVWGLFSSWRHYYNVWHDLRGMRGNRWNLLLLQNNTDNMNLKGYLKKNITEVNGNKWITLPLQIPANIHRLPVSECLLGLRWGGIAGERWLPLNPVQQRLAAGAQRAAGAWRQHGSIDLHLLIKGAEFYGSDGSVVGVEAQGKGHVAEDVLGSEVNAFPLVCYQLYVGYGWVVCDREI